MQGIEKRKVDLVAILNILTYIMISIPSYCQFMYVTLLVVILIYSFHVFHVYIQFIIRIEQFLSNLDFSELLLFDQYNLYLYYIAIETALCLLIVCYSTHLSAGPYNPYCIVNHSTIIYLNPFNSTSSCMLLSE